MVRGRGGIAGVAGLSIGQVGASDGGEESEADGDCEGEHVPCREELLRVMLAAT